MVEAPIDPGHPLDALFATSSLGVRSIARLDGAVLPRRDDLLAVLREAGAGEAGPGEGAAPG